MKIFSKTVSVLALLAALAPSAATAQTPPANTGAAAECERVVPGRLLAGVHQRRHHMEPSVPGPEPTGRMAGPPRQRTPGSPPHRLEAAAAADYYFRTFFDLTGFNAATAVMSFQCAIDNYPVSAGSYFSLNGGAYGGSCGSSNNGYQFTGANTVNSGFVAGINNLTFHVTGDAITDGLVVGDMTLSARAVTATPEPASIVLLATGLIGVFGVARRRRAA
jgi:hypothetical protein